MTVPASSSLQARRPAGRAVRAALPAAAGRAVPGLALPGRTHVPDAALRGLAG